MSSIRKRIGLIGILAALTIGCGFAARPFWHLARTSKHDVDQRLPPPGGYVDDASRLNQTPVGDVVAILPNDAERQLRELLQRARAERRRVSIAGARHSMGGHTIYPNGIAIDMRAFKAMELDADRRILRVGAGAMWSDVIPYLETHGRSVGVMQSNNSFTVGGSLSVNCHGWQFDRPPIASTVESFRLMLADGRIVRCSRADNRELFSLALGGYGLFGVILDADLRVVPNERYRIEQLVVPIADALSTFDATVAGRLDVQMVYARLNIMPSRLFDEAIINAFVRDDSAPPPPLSDPENAKLQRLIFCGSVDSDYGKALRWSAETKLQPLVMGRHFSRNQLLNESATLFEDRSADTTNILHEYFVPRTGAAEFVIAAGEIIRRHRANLLNVTVRSVNEDADTLLRYADRQMIAFVMLFHQSRDASGDAAMRRLTTELIDAALQNGGRYYLPYRLHATTEQFRRAYPQGAEFFRLKRRYDPEELFQNAFYERYGK